MTDEVSEYGQKPVAVDLQRVKAEDVPGLMELVGAAASESATVRIALEGVDVMIDYQELETAMVKEIASWEGSKRPSRFWDASSGGGRAARRDLAKAVLVAAGVLPKPEEPATEIPKDAEYIGQSVDEDGVYGAYKDANGTIYITRMWGGDPAGQPLFAITANGEVIDRET